MPNKVEVKPGDRYGRLEIIKEVEPLIDSKGRKFRKVLCKCECGNNNFETSLRSLRSGATQSCGCINREVMTKIGKERKKVNLFLINVKTKVVTGYDTNMKKFYFDLDDLHIVKKYYWSINAQGYAVARNGETGKSIRLHRLITNAPENKQVDHINRERNDNRRSNLRICTRSENSKNRGIRSDNLSGITGVFWNKKVNKWNANISINGKQKNLGYYKQKEDAIKVRMEAEEKYYGEFRDFKNIEQNNKVFPNNNK